MKREQRTDTERLDWLERYGCDIDTVSRGDWRIRDATGAERAIGFPLRAAIDSAITTLRAGSGATSPTPDVSSAGQPEIPSFGELDDDSRLAVAQAVAGVHSPGFPWSSRSPEARELFARMGAAAIAALAATVSQVHPGGHQESEGK